MDHVVGAELAWAATRARHATLRFNFRGVGASQGEPGGPPLQLEDAEAALRVLEENTGTVGAAVAALGASAATALGLAHRSPGLAGLVLVSPAQLEPEELVRVRLPLLVVLGAKEPLRQAALAAAVGEAGGAVVRVPGADTRFQRNLPAVGRSLVSWLEGLRPTA
jgi:uncharacterized protein